MKQITVNDAFQKNYTYTLTEAMGENFDDDFLPQLTPKEMLALGVFGGVYFNDKPTEFPANWFEKAKLSLTDKDPKLNFFGVNASMPLEHWQKKGWIYHEDPRGRFQWYCRYYMGRRLADEDRRQIKRWKAMKRHVGAIKKNCYQFVRDCRRKQRQALLHRAYDSRNL